MAHSGGKGRSIPKELAPLFNLNERCKLMVLWRRVQFLETRIKQDSLHRGYDIEEIAALRWVLEELGIDVSLLNSES